MRWLGCGLTIALAVAGCSDSHGREDDGGGAGDGGPSVCRPGDPPPVSTYCLSVTPDHVCGDVGLPETCVAGAWQCPAGTTSGEACWCSGLGRPAGACTCTPSGWSCVTDPVDAGPPPFTCPADPSVLVGTWCANQGQTCGECPMPCSGPCNQVTCIDHAWQSLALGCADVVFACGPSTWCSRFSEACIHTLSDVGGVPDDYRCQPFPEDCPSDCTCLGSGCMQDHDGAVIVTRGGG
jgi:hypothetical protein